MKITQNDVIQELKKSGNATFLKIKDISVWDYCNLIYDLRELINFEMWDCTESENFTTNIYHWSPKLGIRVEWEYDFAEDFEKVIDFIKFVVKTHNDIEVFESTISRVKA